MSKELLFSARDIKKNFFSTQALDGVNLDIHSGEVVGLIGENGSGKSTLLKIILGVQPPSSGTMLLHGQAYEPKSPRDADLSGVGMVFQEQSLIVNLSVGQNIFFGQENRFKKNGFIRWGHMYEDASKVLKAVGCSDIDPRKRVSDLNFATRQMVEIAKVVNKANSSSHAHCLIMFDEPTSVLNEQETQRLFAEIRKLTEQGHGVVFVSHRLDEVLEISDHVYVLKDGSNTGDMPVAEASENKLYSLMVGRGSASEYFGIDKQSEAGSEIVLDVSHLGVKGIFKDISFQLRKGEVLGFCGVVGSGKEDICSVLCGDEKPDEGTIQVHGREVRLRSPAHALKKNILMIPMERLAEGVVASLSVCDNVHLSDFKYIKSGCLISKKRCVQMTNEYIKNLRIKTSGWAQSLMNLSGGNQQKVVFARALASKCDIIILNHPTRGVDVGARKDIYDVIHEIVNQGVSVILLGDTLEECIGMSSRIIVMRDGVITKELDAAGGHKPSQVEIVQCMM